MQAEYRVKVEWTAPQYGTTNWYYQTSDGTTARINDLLDWNATHKYPKKQVFRISLYWSGWIKKSRDGFVGSIGGATTARYSLYAIIGVLKDYDLAMRFGLSRAEAMEMIGV